MHVENLTSWTHEHVFDTCSDKAERGTRAVMWITAAMMIVEIAAGWSYNSMALIADGWHMSSHALAIGLSAFAYAAARRYARDPRFAFGTWKVEVLGGFASAVVLLSIALLMAGGSVERMFAPRAIEYQQAIAIAIAGLFVNLICAAILGKAHHHHDTEHHHHHDADRHGSHDVNLKSAYLHVLADAATSVLAILALAGGWLLGWNWLDPVMGLVGAALVAWWARSLLIETGKVLLDREMDRPIVREIKQVVEDDRDGADTRIADLHVWRVGKQVYSCALTVVTHDRDLDADAIRSRLAVHEEIVHSTIEVHRCPDLPAS
jgi:cation diffusion facilitator family transporter